MPLFWDVQLHLGIRQHGGLLFKGQNTYESGMHTLQNMAGANQMGMTWSTKTLHCWWHPKQKMRLHSISVAGQTCQWHVVSPAINFNQLFLSRNGVMCIVLFQHCRLAFRYHNICAGSILPKGLCHFGKNQVIYLFLPYTNVNYQMILYVTTLCTYILSLSAGSNTA
jgi:hypothetical protein